MAADRSGGWRLGASARHLAFGTSLLLLGWISLPMLGWLGAVFHDPKEDMGHGWLIPLFSLYLLWSRRAALRRAAGAPSPLGAMLGAVALLLFWLGERGDQVRLTQIAAIGLLWSITYACWGWRMARLTALPAGFLLFTVPMAFLDFFTVRLRLLSAMLSHILLNGIGVPVLRVGTGLRSLSGAGFSLDVADPCSGLRSIFAMSAITAAYAYLTQHGLWRKWLLFLCAVPLAIVGNMSRIFTIALVAKHFGQDAGTGFYHDYSGYLVFVVSTLLMMQAGAWIARFGPTVSAAAAAPDVAVPGAPVATRHLPLLLLLPLPLLATGWMLRTAPPPQIEPQAFLADTLPAQVGSWRGAQPWYCRDEQCLTVVEDPAQPVCPSCGKPLFTISLSEHTVLPSDTLFLKRNYHHPLGSSYRVTIVVNGETRQSIHRPELCLPAQGFIMQRTRTVTVPQRDGTTVDVRLVDVLRSAGGRQARPMGQAYLFLSGGHQTASHVVRILTSATERAFRNRVLRWAMVTVVADGPFDDEAGLSQLRLFLEDLLPQLRAAAPEPSETAGG